MPEYIDYRAIKDRVSIRDALAHYGLLNRMVEKPNGQLFGNCPFHDSKSGTSFKVSPSYRGFNCFGCDVKGNVLNFVARMESCSVHEAAVEIARWIGHHPPLPAETVSPELVSGDGHDGTVPSSRVVETTTGSEPPPPPSSPAAGRWIR